MLADDERLLFHESPCGLLVTRSDGTIERANAIICRWLARDVSELTSGLRFADLLTIGCKIFHQTHWLPLLQMQGSVAEVQLDVLHKDGRTLPMLVNACVREGGYHYIALFVATDRRKYERELLLARRQAEDLLERERNAQAEVVKLLRERITLAEQLVGIVSHDLRSPLNAIVLGSGLLRSGELSAQQLRVVERIQSAANRANRLTADLLDFTQARLGGGLRVQPRLVDVHGLVGDCVEELRLARACNQLVYERIGAPEGLCDSDRIAQVVTNLVNNALAYGAPGKQVTVKSGVVECVLHLSVHNWGPTIPSRLLPHIFEALQRGDQEVKSGARSVGLGLYIVREIASAHGGEVHVTSTDSEGTTFTIKVPQENKE